MSEAHGAGEELPEAQKEEMVPPQESNLEKLKKLNRGLLRAVSVNTHSFAGLDGEADDWVDLRLGFEERCELWRRRVPLPSPSEVSRLGESGFERDWEASGASSPPAPVHTESLGGSLVKAKLSEDASDAASAADDGVAAGSHGDEVDLGSRRSSREVSEPAVEDMGGGPYDAEEELTPQGKGKGRDRSTTPTQVNRLTIRLPPRDVSSKHRKPVSLPALAAPSTPTRLARKGPRRGGEPSKLKTPSAPAKKKARMSSGKSQPRYDFLEMSSDTEDADIVEFEEEEKKRKRGRPPGSSAKITGALANIRNLDAFSIPAFIEVMLPAQVVKPTTVRGSEKVVTPSPVQLGPIQINNRTTWDKLLNDAASAVMVGKENLVTMSMQWSWVAAKGKTVKTTRWFPLHDETSFHVFIDMLKKTVANDTLGGDEFIVISMAQPITVQRHTGLPWLQGPSAGSVPAVSLARQCGPEHLPTQLHLVPHPNHVPAMSGHPRSNSSVSLDDDVPKIMKQLEQLHGKSNGCDMHPGMRCFYYAPLDWHFELTEGRLRAWACAILKHHPGVDERTPPVGSKWFEYSDTNKSRAPQILGHAGAAAHMPAQAVHPYVGPGTPPAIAYGAPQAPHMLPTAGLFPGYASPQFAPSPFYAGVPAQGPIYPGMYGYVPTPPPQEFAAQAPLPSRNQSGPFTYYNPYPSFPFRRS
ncbi:hypothetical protein K466DRAFT_652998 [Polyporus arcularius HHB13444]|uniref:Uncharacterized protein n=1 Tax=Polyporus arcularius HHB13444 TaxID=1314778 RepID=A0A5C3PDF8_9APHY|nr:hypothetical protein K466DRAFT_652998 [Polyporus arcularius HHB13444]